MYLCDTLCVFINLPHLYDMFSLKFALFLLYLFCLYSRMLSRVLCILYYYDNYIKYILDNYI